MVLNDEHTSGSPGGHDAASHAAVADVLLHRRTINNFREELPPRDSIVAAIDAARFAPNHHLTEPWHFYLLSEDTKNSIVELNAKIVLERRGPEAAEEKRRRWSAIPGWIVVSCDRSDDAVRAREDYAAVCCAIHSMTLYLWTLGIGCKWTTGPVTRDSRFFDLVWINPKREDVVGLLWYGYPMNIPDTKRKPVDQILIDV